MIDKATIESELIAEEYLFALFARVFGTTPDAGLLLELISDDAREALSGFLSEEQLVDFDVLQSSLSMALGEDDELKNLADEYFRGLEAPGSMIAYPWESVYTEGAPLIFQKSTLSVIESFRQEGFRLELEANVPQDHIAYELLFMALLASQNNQEGYLRFKDEHLLRWVPRYCDDLQALPNSNYLTTTARLLKAFVEKA